MMDGGLPRSGTGLAMRRFDNRRGRVDRKPVGENPSGIKCDVKAVME